jgi:hypothetical protein
MIPKQYELLFSLWGGQFAPTFGGQVGAFLRGQGKATFGGQVQRFLQPSLLVNL